ncbi:hypothetical protein NJH24_17155 [Pseudomonas asiatica]|uniref:hypothetical protein n=1 Tax=Pseudomonas asiatica TaxID=2219225 RepID=UPI00209B2D6C|nr:hypothetical protein [Pseudomonas asiatica]MCO7536506.1 hypothetical protein [Pseudomonas asiatica]MCO7550254.1 hypothetical protein [Pseudomonas asiatica]MCO7560613.1 hypothetical protein [Pseudomonas asiatica]
MSNITIQLTLDEQQAKHYLQWLAGQYTHAMSEVWYSDRYRHVPTGQRGRKVLEDLPHLRGISRTHKALEAQLGTASTERSR